MITYLAKRFLFRGLPSIGFVLLAVLVTNLVFGLYMLVFCDFSGSGGSVVKCDKSLELFFSYFLQAQYIVAPILLPLVLMYPYSKQRYTKEFWIDIGLYGFVVLITWYIQDFLDKT
jgi:hypothetical protein